MAQGDYLIQNQSFPSFRSDLNSTLEAINTSNSGTSRPSSAVAGTIWLDTTSASSPTLKFYDGSDDISLATLDYTANTVNWLDSVVSGGDVVDDTTPQLGGNLDVNGNSIVSVSNGNITFTPDGSGKVIIDGLSHPTSDGTANQNLITDGAGNLSFSNVIPSDNTVTNAKIVDSTIALGKLSATGTKDATTFLRGDNTFAEAGGGGIEEADYYYTNSGTSLSSATKTLISNWARNTQGVKIGTGMSVSSGIWTFPSTGIYLINVNLNHNASANNRYIYSEIQSTTDNSTYTTLIRGYSHIYQPSSSWWAGTSISIIFDCTNTTNDKIKILAQSENASEVPGGATDVSQAVFVKIGDT
jgi:hypothetical protein